MNQPLLELKNIGKIYVSDSNVAVGIRGVNLTFNRGEFVAVTGKSGSGKSTLLNVISGMDTYEEGELLLEGEPTSHFMQKDWEEYRKQYVSFIFQDYNIIESFTVLQNVELALMNIENPRERRDKAMELLRRVGMEQHVHHKGSKLSGGQKQRTVIARALAKDSPIILADEPTGNLDSRSSEEIIELLREVSRDKLVIVVTHNFEQVQEHATRHIRIFDGAVELDHTIRPAAPVTDVAHTEQTTAPATLPRRTLHALRNGLILGRVRFTATPKLSVFLCILMTVTALVLSMVTSLTAAAGNLFQKQTMFTHVPGRTVIVRQDGGIITEEELEKLAAEVGAHDHLHYDFMLDRPIGLRIGEDYDWYEFAFGYPADSVELDLGRYPEAINEVILEVPISFQKHLGDGDLPDTALPLFEGMANYRVVGVRYFYDNTKTCRMLFTEEGYRTASAIAYFYEQRYNFNYRMDLYAEDAPEVIYGLSMEGDTVIDFDLPAGSYFVNHHAMSDYLEHLGLERGALTLPEGIIADTVLSGNFYNYSYDYYGGYYGDVMIEIEKPGYGEEASVQYPFTDYRLVLDVSDSLKESLENRYYEKWQTGVGIPGPGFVVLSPDILVDFMYENYYTEAYTQASLFFENDREAHRTVETLRELGYTAVVSDATVESDVYEVLLEKLEAVMMAFTWIMVIGFSTVFLSLCSSRAMNATRGDIAIMRSMGIPTAVVRVSIYIQTLIALIPAAVITAVTCTVIYLSPKTNGYFPFLHAPDYLLISAVLVLIALNLARKYVKRMFSDSVKKTLKGGSKA